MRKFLPTAAVVGTLAVVLALAGNYHFLYGLGHGFEAIHKVSWSLSETIINRAEVEGTSPASRRDRFPLFMMAWKRENDRLGAETLTNYQRERDASRSRK